MINEKMKWNAKIAGLRHYMGQIDVFGIHPGCKRDK